VRSGRDDNSAGPLAAFRLTAFGAISMQQNCHPDRSAAQWRDLLFPFPFPKWGFALPCKVVADGWVEPPQNECEQVCFCHANSAKKQ
jgi:hypothetical protein